MISELDQFHILKKLSYLHNTSYEYEIDEDGNGIAFIDGYRVEFEVNKYGEIELWSAKITKEEK